MIRRLGLVLAVLAAMALGRAITDLVPVGEGAADPFYVDAGVGEKAELTYADLTVERVQAARRLVADSRTTAQASGVFLVVDVRMRATEGSVLWLGIQAFDRQGRTLFNEDRASCAGNTTSPAGVPWNARFCFDVPRESLEGLRLELARGLPANDLQRRDHVARIDLGIDADEARRWGATTQTLTSFQSGFETPPGEGE